MDWAPQDVSKLWRYNLHYFDYLHWPSISNDAKAALIESWIQANKPGAPDAWEPYPISLRAVNWIKWFWLGTAPTPGWTASLAHQLAWLDRNLEYHLLANHLLKNAKALVFGGLFFSGPQADAMLKKGLRLMVEQGQEQILPDGGHYERSAMYHAIALEDYLDVVNVLSRNRGFATGAELVELRATATRALAYFSDILAADGEIPLFNDAAFGITPPAAAILDYGRQVLGAETASGADLTRTLRVDKPHTGYFGYRHGGDSFLIDCGFGGPDYQMGHAHADTLSYELCVGGRRVVVDSGVFDYEDNELRHFLRGTAAHNTVRVDGADQSEVWGVFRVARRARPLFAELSGLDGGTLTFRGAHDGYRRLPGRVMHERRVTADLAGQWDIADRVTGAGEHLLENFIHLHPACSLERIADKEFMVRVDGGQTARIAMTCDAGIDVRPGWHCPEFGKRKANTVLVLSATRRLPAEMSYTIRKA